MGNPSQSDDNLEQLLEELEQEATQGTTQSDQTAPKKSDLKVIQGGAAPTTDAAMKEFAPAASDDAQMEATLGNLKEEEPSGDSLLAQSISGTDSEAQLDAEIEEAVHEVKNRRPSGQATASDPGNLTLSLKGSMSLKLVYETGTEHVLISFEDDALHVSLQNGTEFKIPVGAKKN